jgi:5-methyltetrahydropteroyltriglutamate--homocysteine methyltransferase
MMAIPTESVGSIPRPVEVPGGWEDFEAGRISRERLERLLEEAVHTTIGELEATGSPIVTDGHRRLRLRSLR